MNRALPFVLMVIVITAISYVLWPTGTDSDPADHTSNPASAQAQTPEAGTLSDAAGPTRRTSSDRLAVRVFDADGAAVSDGTVVARIDGELVRAAVSGGVAELPRPIETLGVAALADDVWSAWQQFPAVALENLQEVRLELDEPAAYFALQVQYDNGSTAQKLRMFLTSDDPRCDASLPAAGWIDGVDGKLDSGPLAPGDYGFKVQAEGAVPHQEGMELDAAALILENLTLQRAGAIEGMVRNATGPVEGAVVVAVGAEMASRSFSGLKLFRTYGTLLPQVNRDFTATTDADGKFRIDVVRQGEYLLLVKAQQLRPLVVEPAFSVQPLGVAGLGTLELHAGNTIVVEVLGLDGKPQEDAMVRWKTGSEGLLGRFSQLGDNSLPTDAAGRVTLYAIPEGLIAVSAEHASSARVEDVIDFAAGSTASESLMLQLTAGASLTGLVVRDSDGAPIPMAQLNLFAAGGGGLARLTGEGSVAEAHSSDDGEFRLDHVPAGEYLLEVTHPEYARMQIGPLELEGISTAPPLRLGYGGTIEVHTQTPDGSPLANAQVALSDTLTGANDRQQSDDTGRCVFERLAPGTYQVALVGLPEDVGSGSIDVAMAFVTVEAGETEVVKLGGSGPTADVEGLVTRRGEPLSGATVIVILPSGAKVANTEADGAYRLEKVPLGEHILMLQLKAGGIGGGAHYEGLQVASTGTVQHDIALPGTAIQVTVLDEASGGPIAGMPVSLRPADGSNISGADFGLTNVDGKTSFDAVAGGLYLVAAGRQTLPILAGEELDRYAAKQVQVQIPNSGEHDQAIELRLAAGATFRARVSDRDGNYLAGANLFYLDADGQPLSVLSMKGTNSKGVAQLVGLPEGPGHILVRHSDYGVKEIPVDLRAGEVAKQEVKLESGTALYVEIVDGEGQPVSGVLAVAIDERGASLSTLWTMQESQTARTAFFGGGAQKLGPLPAGSYTVRLIRPGRPAVEHRVNLGGEPEKRVRLSYNP